jgi:glycerophosphoryl diester phosphodiesterase
LGKRGLSLKDRSRVKKQFIKNLDSFTLAAHRGASQEHPANTMEAFGRALEIDEKALLEMDVWETADGHAVVMHDGTVEQATNGTGSVSSFSLEEIQRLDAGYAVSFDGGISHPFRGKGYRIPSLEEILSAFPHVLKSIDVKYHDRNFTRNVLETIKNYGESEYVIMGSFNGSILRFIRRMYPLVATSASKKEIVVFLIAVKLRISRLCTLRCDVFSIPEFSSGKYPEYEGKGCRQGIRVITPAFIRAAHRRGIPIFAWTIDREENMRRLLGWGIDGIITNRPDALKKIVDETRES